MEKKAKSSTPKYRCREVETVIDMFENRGWKRIDIPLEEEEEDEFEEEAARIRNKPPVPRDGRQNWDVMWASSCWVINHILGIISVVGMKKDQRINHFPNSYQLTRKDLTTLNLCRYKRSLRNTEKDGKQNSLTRQDFFYPDTFLLPNDSILFRSEIKKNPDIWIIKPVMGARGEGIEIISSYEEACDFLHSIESKHYFSEGVGKIKWTYCAQRYIKNPYLINGCKFDLRLYVLVLSFRPLVTYSFRGGFARFSNSKYDLKDLDPMIHLTNVSIQGEGTKMDVSEIREHVEKENGVEKADQLFNEIQALCLNSLQSVSQPMIQDQHCFELYGFDILFDSNLKPWLIEINSSPSMVANSEHDYDLKYSMIGETVDLALMTRNTPLANLPKHHGGFDMIWNKIAEPVSWKKLPKCTIGYPFNIKHSQNNPFSK